MIGEILVLFMYITRLASKEIFLPSNKIHREVGRAKDLSAPGYLDRLALQDGADSLSKNVDDILPFHATYNLRRPCISLKARRKPEIKPSSKYSVLCYMSHPPLLPQYFFHHNNVW